MDREQLTDVLNTSIIEGFIQAKLRQYKIYIDDLDSIKSEVCQRLIPKIENIDLSDRDSQNAYICKTIQYIIFEKKREQSKFQSVDYDLDSYQNTSINSESSYAEIQELYKFIDQLSEQDKEVLIWHDIEGLTYREISEKYQEEQGRTVSEKALRKRRQRAIEKLRELYEIASLL